jgi:hypothetical protein
MIILYVYFYKKYKTKEDFIGILEILKEYNDRLGPSRNEEVIEQVNIKEDGTKQVNIKEESKQVNKQEKRYVYIEPTDNPSKYRFYDKNYNNYTNLYIDQQNIKLYDPNNNIIGKLISEIYNKFTLNIDYYNKNNIHIDFYNNFNELKLYVEDDDKYFYIKNIDNEYSIFLFNKNIGKIYYDNSYYKIIVYEDYKNYLNLFGIGLILLLRN